MNNNHNRLLIDKKVLLNKRHVFLVVRMVIAPQGCLDSGTIVDAQGEIVGRFHRLPEAIPLIEGWLASVTTATRRS
ncbi:MAG: hypothetical protein R3C14_42315 [Caldilineaceae bacterium]